MSDLHVLRDVRGFWIIDYNEEQTIIMWINLCCFVQYVVLSHDGTQQRTVTITGLRRMPLMLGEKYAADLEVRILRSYRPSMGNCEEAFINKTA